MAGCRALWDACVQITKDAGKAAEMRLIKAKVTSLRSLEAVYGPYSAIVVAAGAANGTIEDIGGLPCTSSMPQAQSPKLHSCKTAVHFQGQQQLIV